MQALILRIEIPNPLLRLSDDDTAIRAYLKACCCAEVDAASARGEIANLRERAEAGL